MDTPAKNQSLILTGDPLDNYLVMKTITEYLPHTSLKACRQVCSKWNRNISKTFFNKSQITVDFNHLGKTLDSLIQTFPLKNAAKFQNTSLSIRTQHLYYFNYHQFRKWIKSYGPKFTAITLGDNKDPSNYDYAISKRDLETLLMSWCPQLKSLKLIGKFSNQLITRFTEIVPGNIGPPLLQLEHFELFIEQYCSHVLPIGLEMLMRVPNLKIFKFTGTGVHLSELILEQIIKLMSDPFQNLNTFQWKLHSENEYMSRTETFSERTFALLGQLKFPCLKKLYISGPTTCMAPPHFIKTEPPFPSEILQNVRLTLEELNIQIEKDYDDIRLPFMPKLKHVELLLCSSICVNKFQNDLASLPALETWIWTKNPTDFRNHLVFEISNKHIPIYKPHTKLIKLHIPTNCHINDPQVLKILSEAFPNLNDLSFLIKSTNLSKYFKALESFETLEIFKLSLTKTPIDLNSAVSYHLSELPGLKELHFHCDYPLHISPSASFLACTDERTDQPIDIPLESCEIGLLNCQALELITLKGIEISGSKVTKLESFIRRQRRRFEIKIIL